jgi:hypothetical protein
MTRRRVDWSPVPAARITKIGDHFTSEVPMNELLHFFLNVFSPVFAALMLYFALRDFVVYSAWPWLREKWQSRRKVAA